MDEGSIDLGVGVIAQERKEDHARTLKLKVDVRWFWTVLVAVLSALVLRSFIEPLLWAVVVAIATWPIYRRLALRFRTSTTSSAFALLFTTLVSLFLLGPIVFAFGTLVVQAQYLIHQIAVTDKAGLATPAWLESLPLVGTTLADRWQNTVGVPGGLSASLHRADTFWVLGWAQTLGQFLAHHLFIVAFTILVLFFLYRGGDALAVHVGSLLHDRFGDRAESHTELAITALRATVNGMVAVGLFDGVLSGLIYALAGVEHAEVWGVVTGLFAMIPFLGYAAVAGVALALVSRSAMTAALAVCALGAVVLLAGDKVVRPLLVGNAARLGFVWVLMGSLGGLELLGPLGLFAGPVVLALAGALWKERTKRRIVSGDTSHGRSDRYSRAVPPSGQ